MGDIPLVHFCVEIALQLELDAHALTGRPHLHADARSLGEVKVLAHLEQGTAPGQTAIADELTYCGAFVDRIGRRVGYHFGKTTIKIREVTGCSARLEVDGKGDLR